MKKACLMVTPRYFGDRIFAGDRSFDPNDHLAPFRALKAKFAEAGYALSTQDLHPPNESVFALYNDVLPAVGECPAPAFALLLESEAVLPANFRAGAHAGVRRVFTWDTRMVASNIATKVNYSFAFPDTFPHFGRARDGFCVMISSNRKSGHRGELYSARERIARSFPHEGPFQLDLFGPGWDRRAFLRADRYLSRIPLVSKAWHRAPRTWRGVAGDKLETLSRYRFSICYENVQGLPGYVTEKIFDCFQAGTVPVYWGASDIQDLVPSDCFVDRRSFDSDEQLLEHLKDMPDSRVEEYRSRMFTFLDGEARDKFGVERFAETVATGILERLEELP